MLCTYCGFLKEAEQDKGHGIPVRPELRKPHHSIYSDEYKAVVDKKISGKRLGRKELAAMNEALRYAGLISSYGAKAVVAFSVYGVGRKARQEYS